jgi:hypothetical protein
LDEKLEHEILDVNIYKTTGEILIRKNGMFSELSQEINSIFSRFPSGTYFISVSNQKDFRKSLKVIVIR